MIESDLYYNPPLDRNMFVFYLIFFWFYVFVLLTFIIQSILWAKIYDLVVHKTNETKKKQTSKKSSRILILETKKRRQYAARSVEHSEETKQWTPPRTPCAKQCRIYIKFYLD